MKKIIVKMKWLEWLDYWNIPYDEFGNAIIDKSLMEGYVFLPENQ
jgi:hypothetical protein